MNKKILTALYVTVALAAGTFVLAQSGSSSASGDPRIDKILEQNEKILKNQDEILKELNEVKDWVNWLRRRSS